MKLLILTMITLSFLFSSVTFARSRGGLDVTVTTTKNRAYDKKERREAREARERR
jgi:hypothetical protein